MCTKAWEWLKAHPPSRRISGNPSRVFLLLLPFFSLWGCVTYAFHALTHCRLQGFTAWQNFAQEYRKHYNRIRAINGWNRNQYRCRVTVSSFASVYVVFIWQRILYVGGWFLAAKAKPRNRHVRALKQPLEEKKELETSTQNRLKRPQIRKAALLRGREGRKRGPRIAIASLAGTAGVTAAQRKWQRRNEPPPQWVGGLHRERPKGVATVEFFSLLSESMTQCVFLFNRAGTFFGTSDSA